MLLFAFFCRNLSALASLLVLCRDFVRVFFFDVHCLASIIVRGCVCFPSCVSPASSFVCCLSCAIRPGTLQSVLVFFSRRLASVRSCSMCVIWVVVCFSRFFLLGVSFWSVFAWSAAARWDMLLPLLFLCVVSSLVCFFFSCPVLARG